MEEDKKEVEFVGKLKRQILCYITQCFQPLLVFLLQ